MAGNRTIRAWYLHVRSGFRVGCGLAQKAAIMNWLDVLLVGALVVIASPFFALVGFIIRAAFHEKCFQCGTRRGVRNELCAPCRKAWEEVELERLYSKEVGQ